jgi:hypothetical protein
LLSCEARRRRSSARPRSIRRSALYPNASAPIRAMPISASFPLASSRRFATWTSSAISVPFGARRSPLLARPRPRSESSIAIFYRLTVEETAFRTRERVRTAAVRRSEARQAASRLPTGCFCKSREAQLEARVLRGMERDSDEANRSARQHGRGCRTDGLACNARPMVVSLRRRTRRVVLWSSAQ